MTEFAFFARVDSGYGNRTPAVVVEQVEIIKRSPKQVKIAAGCWGSHHGTHLHPDEVGLSATEALDRLWMTASNHVESMREQLAAAEAELGLVLTARANPPTPVIIKPEKRR